MTKLTAGQRNAMPDSEFAGPGKSFPVNDKAHARLAISGATRSERAGNISPSTEASIKAKARARLPNAGSYTHSQGKYKEGTHNPENRLPPHAFHKGRGIV